MRIDKWLWAARLTKTRGIAADALKAGRVTINGAVAKPSRDVAVGDHLELRIGPTRRVIDVKGLAETGETTLRRLHELKTGRLIGASVECVLLLTDREERASTLPHFRDFAAELGVLFQIVDDILDVTGTEDSLGKPRGSDERHGKLTYVSSYGLEGAREMASESHEKASSALRRAAPGGAAELEQITDFIYRRTS